MKFVNHKYILFLLSYFILIQATFSQFNFENANEIIVVKNNDTLINAWGGGLNYAQISDFDYDFDGDKDLFVFDRSTNNIRVFTQEQIGSKKFYKHQYNARTKFPNDLQYRTHLADYNGDGKNDLFTYGIGGIKVYKNIGNSTIGLQWELISETLKSKYPSFTTNLYVSSSDIPAIVDVDNDGDLDILTFSISGQNLEYHQNQSQELYNHSDSLKFELMNECWGKFSESANDNSVILNETAYPCTGSGVSIPKKTPSEVAPKHSGSTVLALDYDGNGVLDLILGDVAYPNLTLLINGGSTPNTNSAMISQDNSFPSYDVPANMQLFLAPFYVDVDFDGLRDLIACPNAKSVSHNQTSIWYYKNIGTNTSPIFDFVKTNFLQDEMLDFGSGSIPVLADINGDGLKDLFVSAFFQYKETLTKESKIAYYQNVGTSTTPKFQWMSDDFLNLSGAGYGLRIVPSFGDLDGDNDLDLILSTENGPVKYYKNLGNSSTANFVLQGNLNDNTNTVINQGQFSSVQLFDLNKDNKLDLIIGKKSGEMAYYENIGTNANFSFQLKNNQLGGIDISGNNPDAYIVPHFFKMGDSLYLFLGTLEGKLIYYGKIENNINSGQSFQLRNANLCNVQAEGYSSFFTDDLDNNGQLNLFFGNDLGGINHLEIDPNSTSSVAELYEVEKIMLVPNPAQNNFKVIGLEQAFHYYILDLSGKTQISNKINGKENIDIQNLSAGYYFILIESESFSYSLPFVKN